MVILWLYGFMVIYYGLVKWFTVSSGMRCLFLIREYEKAGVENTQLCIPVLTTCHTVLQFKNVFMRLKYKHFILVLPSFHFRFVLVGNDFLL